MSVQQNSAAEAAITFRQPPQGSCWSVAMLTELARLLSVKVAVAPNLNPVAISQDNNNLAVLDASGALLVPSITFYNGNIVVPGGSSETVVFSGWAAAIDATTALMVIDFRPDGTEPGVETAPDSDVFIRPSYEVRSRSPTEIHVKVWHATKASTLFLTLIQFPIPPDQT